MRYFIGVIDSISGSGTPEESIEIDAFNDMLERDGHWITAGGISAPEHSTVIDNRHGAGITKTGPLYENKEFISGFWIIEAASEDEAMRLATEGSRACNRRVEVRPFLR